MSDEYGNLTAWASKTSRLDELDAGEIRRLVLDDSMRVSAQQLLMDLGFTLEPTLEALMLMNMSKVGDSITTGRLAGLRKCYVRSADDFYRLVSAMTADIENAITGQHILVDLCLMSAAKGDLVKISKLAIIRRVLAGYMEHSDYNKIVGRFLEGLMPMPTKSTTPAPIGYVESFVMDLILMVT